MGGLEEVETVEQRVEGSGQSLLEELRAERERFDAEHEHIRIAIPGYNGRLVAQYEPVPWEETEKVSKKARKDKAPGYTLRAAQDRLLRACQMILVRQEEDGELVGLHEAVPELGPEPVTYANPRLAEIAGESLAENGSQPTARKIMLAVFPNEDAVMTHHALFDEKVSLAEEQADEDF